MIHTLSFEIFSLQPIISNLKCMIYFYNIGLDFWDEYSNCFKRHIIILEKLRKYILQLISNAQKKGKMYQLIDIYFCKLSARLLYS